MSRCPENRRVLVQTGVVPVLLRDNRKNNGQRNPDFPRRAALELPV